MYLIIKLPLPVRPGIIFLLLIMISCQTSVQQAPSEETDLADNSIHAASQSWQQVDTIDIEMINSDLQTDYLTIDVGIYFPSNFDTAFHKVTLNRLLESFKAAKEIYAPTGVQLHLLWVKSGWLDPTYFSIQANQLPTIPATEYVNMYHHMRRNPAQPTTKTLEAFKAIVQPHPDNKRTMYLVALQDVFYPFLEVSEGRNWVIKTVRTGGLSFPTYMYVETLPEAYRGVITISNLQREDRYRRTVAHEIGHKAINVSHEYNETNPGHEIYAAGGLMLYGNGEDIPSGKSGRWHQERLRLSPFIYRLNADGSKSWNPDYEQGGHYYDPIYGDYVVHFPGAPPIDEDW